MPQKALNIIAFYKQINEEGSDLVFPELRKANWKDPKDIHRKICTATKKFNVHLNKIAKLAGIEKDLTNHISRHSFGNISGEKISPQMLQKLYRHSNIQTTMGYQANFIHGDTDGALASVVDF